VNIARTDLTSGTACGEKGTKWHEVYQAGIGGMP
jgi:hypothetical protein